MKFCCRKCIISCKKNVFFTQFADQKALVNKWLLPHCGLSLSHINSVYQSDQLLKDEFPAGDHISSVSFYLFTVARMSKVITVPCFMDHLAGQLDLGPFLGQYLTQVKHTLKLSFDDSQQKWEKVLINGIFHVLKQTLCVSLFLKSLSF